MTIQNIHHLFLKCNKVSIDTRNIQLNSFFVAIKGERFDANTFAKEALEKGAGYVVIDNPKYYIDDRTIIVEDSLKALQELAKYHRQFLKLPIIALTGSNGKTTTKELINVVLSKKFRTIATVGNLNNHIGVPLTLLSFTNDTEIGIVEMGANHQKEIEFLCEIAQPDYGYITNFGKAHLEGFGGVEGVIKGKSEMYTFLQENYKSVFVNLDDEIQNTKTTNFKRITFSQNETTANVYIDSITANPFVKIVTMDVEINSRLIGLYNANNINAAITIGNYFDIPTNDIKTAIESYVPENNRSQLLMKSTNEIILDAYNANPSSMNVALDNFIQLDKDNKMVIIGDMYELGQESLEEHKAIVDFLNDNSSFECHFVGKDFFSNKIQNENFHFHKTFDEFAQFLTSIKLENKTLLIKGSRGMALERTLEYL
ncbi:MAG: UDP-N-acetylmuramoyl-tripeptide--D-alanyl-D-alanine ligase [Flavobacterium sp.]|nr:UDP-N-acetylmuramoyl-tripeptide--D-alanyl-D-alanine ligase [Flavobacterium sp.]